MDELSSRVSHAPTHRQKQMKTLLNAIHKSIANRDFQQAHILKQHLERQLSQESVD